MVISTLAVATNQEKEWLKISVFAVCVFPPLYVVLIWFTQNTFANGSVGAALANLLGETSLLIWGWIVLPQRVRQRGLMRPGLQVISLCAAMALVVFGLQRLGLSILLYVPVGALIYLGGAWALKLITPDDINLVKSALLSRTHRKSAVAIQPTATPEPVEAKA